MTLERFARVNLVLVPILVIVGYRYLESLPAILAIVGGAYVTFAGALTGAWWLSRASLALEGD